MGWGRPIVVASYAIMPLKDHPTYYTFMLISPVHDEWINIELQIQRDMQGPREEQEALYPGRSRNPIHAK